MTGFNKYELELFSKKAADAFLRDGVDLDDSITALARENGFTEHHIDRVAQKANSFVNAELVKSARDTKNDPRISFKLASAADVKKRVSGQEKRAADESRAAELALQAAFTLPRKTVDKVATVNGTFGQPVGDPMASKPVSLDPDEVASAYVKQAHVAEAVAPKVDAGTLELACQTLDTLVSRAVSDCSLAKIAAQDAEQAIWNEVTELMLSGHSPATLRDVVRVGVGDSKLAGYVDGVITAVGADVGAREGKSQLVAGAAVNGSHPLLAKIAEVIPALENRRRAERGRDLLTKAASQASADHRRAVRERRL
jgi:hypothetical protein